VLCVVPASPPLRKPRLSHQCCALRHFTWESRAFVKIPRGRLELLPVTGAPIAFTECVRWRPSSLLLSAADRVSYAPGYALRCAFIPPVDYRSSYQLRSLTGADDNFSRTFDVCGMDRYRPFGRSIRARIVYLILPVLHSKVFRTAAFLGPLHTTCPKLVSKGQPRCDG
jgi:hypothetical protein